MATTTQRTAMVQIPLSPWAIFCTALESDAVPHGEMRTFTRSLLGPYFPTAQTNGATENTTSANTPMKATGKASDAANTRAETRQRTRAARSGSRREQLISLIRSSSEGLARGEILEKMGLKGDKSGEMSVSNA